MTDSPTLPPEEITINGKTWRREQPEPERYQWVRELTPEEYPWSQNEVSVVGNDTPLRMVSLRHEGSEWVVEGVETAGPTQSRPGYAELISREYFETVADHSQASRVVREFLESLS